MATESSTALERAIRSQPEELERLLHVPIHTAVERLLRCHRLWLVGTGTSLHAAQLASAMLYEAGRAAKAISAFHFVHWPPVIAPYDGVIVITHTAETAYALAARAQVMDAGLKVVSITAQGAGLLDALETVEKERSETYTVSYTAALVLLARIANSMGAEALDARAVEAVPLAVSAAIDDPGIEAIDPPKRLLLLYGAGPAAITAREGALKVREASRSLAEGYDPEYLLHGSAVPLNGDDRMVLLSPPEDSDGFTRAVGRAGEQAGVPFAEIAEPADLHPLLAQIPLTARLQLLALKFALARQEDPDTVITGPWADPGLWSLGAPSS